MKPDGGGNGEDALVLCYHGVSEGWPASLAVTPEALERQLSKLIAAGYVATTFKAAVLEPPASRTLAVTFDDAYRSVFQLAAPIMSELGIPGTVFAPTAFIGSERPMSWPGIAHWVKGQHRRELTPMSWEELGQLADAGWEIGSHTRSHPRLPALDRTAAFEELEMSRLECEARLGAPCTSLAYPYGDHSPDVLEAARAAGYLVAGAMAWHVQRPVPLAWPRVAVYRGDGDLRFRLKTSGPMRKLRNSPAWRARLWLGRPARRVEAGS